VGIARAYCNEPEVLFMDEPFSALDAQTRYLMQKEIMRIWEKEKRTVIFVTNNIEEALYLADRIILFTNCPASIKKEYVIDLPRPRDYTAENFLKLRDEITRNMDRTL
jgi:NitT/TauT family transport system ATP-binding protein/sulfonate transport system ATP-binding protein